MKTCFPTRREFLQALGAGLVIAIASPLADGQEVPRPTRGPGRGGGRGGRGGGRGGGAVSISARVHIARDGTITVMTGKVECGQGARATITQAAAEELRVSPLAIALIMGDTSLCPDDGGTYGSQTTPRTLPSVRAGCAAAREVLMGLAARQWGVQVGEVEAGGGKVVGARGRELTYGEIAGSDSVKTFSTTRPSGASVTAVKQWKVMGTPLMRNDARTLVTGGHVYPSDIVRPGMLYGQVLRPSSYGATLSKIDLAAAKGMTGVVVAQDGDFIGVAAGTSYAAAKAISALAKTAVWNGKPRISSSQLFEHLRSHAVNLPAANPLEAEMAASHRALRQVYTVAYVQHAPMEPRTAVAEWQDGKVTVWTGSQNPFGVKSDLRQALGLGPESVRVIVPDFGGAFGGKHTGEAAVEAARLAAAAKKPVRVRWTREEEFTWAYFRPAGVIITEAGLDEQGRIGPWYFVNINSGSSGVQTPYRVGANRTLVCESAPPLRQGSYRGLAATANHFARESFMDELAEVAGSDPLSFRLAHLDDPRLRAVLQTAAEKFGFAARWAKKEPGVGVGLACGTEKGSYVAACVEVAVSGGTVAVRMVCQAFECGAIVNPPGLLSQVQGAIVMGLGPVLREEVQFEKGRVTNGNFSDYAVPRMADLPELAVHLLDRRDIASAGAGETPIMAVGPAIGNAVFHATGKRSREMPIRV